MSELFVGRGITYPMRVGITGGIAPADASTTGLIAFDVRNALTRWEPRIEVLDVTVRRDDDQPTLLYIDITYAIRETNDPRNLVFPFYVIPEEE
jgi:phage baseplate assembly protein W